MVYNKKVEGEVLRTIADGNTFYHADKSESTYAETGVYYKDERLVEVYVANQPYRRGENSPKKQVKLHKSILEKLGFEVVID